MIRAIVGAQTGSEAKGAVCYALRNDFDTHVRVGGPNAGHTIYHHGRKWAMQAVPCGWTNPEAMLILGAGAVIDPDQLALEVKALDDAGHQVFDRLWIDQNATILTKYHREAEGFIYGSAHKKIGSTGKGVGLARMSKLGRGVLGDDELADHAIIAKQAYRAGRWEERLLQDSRRILQDAHLAGERILLEGTQGWGLSLDHGPWPYVTSANTGAAQLASDTGLPPQHTKCTIVARTYPIRVAGNSGPFHAGETSWEELGLEPETTTVTKKTRRVGNWSLEEVQDAVKSNGADSIALMCLDQKYHGDHGATTYEELTKPAKQWLHRLENDLQIPVVFVGTGPQTIIKTGELP